MASNDIIYLGRGMGVDTSLSRADHVHIVYVDDSAQDNKFQVICGVIVPDWTFDALEAILGITIFDLVPTELQNDFEFHTSDLLNASKPFQNVSRDEAMTILERAVKAIESQEIAIVYGAVDLKKLYASRYSSANVVDIAFGLCAESAEEYLQSQALASLGVIISDDTANKAIKNSIQNRFRMLRKPFHRGGQLHRGTLRHMHDDMYFGDSRHSLGIQMADMCSLLISRHLAGPYPDTEDLYQRISKKIFKGEIEPKGEGANYLDASD